MYQSLPRSHQAIALPLLCWAAITVFADRAEAGPDLLKPIASIHQQVWRTEEGLPQNTVPAITQSADGYLWFGTELGLVRFDGMRFTVFDRSNTPELKSNVVDALLTDHAGNLWIGTVGGGLTLLRNGLFKTFTTAEGLSNDAVRCLLEDHSGNLWIGTDSGGLNRFSHGRFTVFGTHDGLAANEVFALAQDTAENIWIGTHNGLSRLSHGVFRNFRQADGLPSDYIRSLYVAPAGVLWVGTGGGGLVRLQNDVFKTFTTRDGLSSNQIASIRLDADGNLWVGTLRGGINRLSGNRFNSYTPKEGFSGSDVWSIYQDRDQNIWLGTGGGGITRLLLNTIFHTLGVHDGLSNPTALPILEDDQGKMWIGTNGGGLNFIKNGRISALTVVDGLADNTVFSLTQALDHSLWIGTGKGLNRLKNGKIATYRQSDGLPSDVVAESLTDHEGNLWFGTRAGLVCFRDGRFTTYTTKNGLSSNVIRSIYEDRSHRLWIGTVGGGLNRLENGRFKIYDLQSGLSNSVVSAIYQDATGILWIGTNGGGLNRLENGRFTVITARDGLLDDAVFRILEDNHGNLWLSGNKGVSRVRLAALNAFAAHTIDRIDVISYGETDGMATQECNGGFQPAGWKTQDGKMWFPTMQGVVVVDPDRLHVQSSQSVLIERAFVDRREVRTGADMRIPPGHGELEFQYSAPNLRAPSKVLFRYRLEGFDRDWIDAGTRRVAFYTNIPPGPYRFLVGATNGDGSWSSQSAGLSFKLMPHFYQTPLFIALLGAGLIAIAFMAYRLHVNDLRVRERTLERHVSERTSELRYEIAERQRAEDALLSAKEAAERASRVKSEFLANMSHEIRTPMNGIVGMTELALTSDTKEEQNTYLEIVKKSADHLLAILNDILDFSKVESGKCDLELLAFDLRENLNETVRSLAFRADQKSLRILCDIAPDVPEIVNADSVRLRQIILNLMGNALKFTDAGEVVLRVRCDALDESTACLHFIVSDTGIGIPEDKLGPIFDAFSQADTSITRTYGGTGLGLAICARLVKLMGGELWVESKLGQGSQFHFTAKLEAAVSTFSGSAQPRLATDGDRAAGASPAGEPLAHILIAEDNSASRMLARVTLERAGFRVQEASNGVQALNAVRFGRFDVVLMDCRMPVMDGYMAAQQIRQLPGPVSQIPIIALTASAFKEDRERTEQAGMDDFLSKPFHPQDLVAKCLAWARSNAGQQPPALPAASRMAKLPNDDDFSPGFLADLIGMFLSSAPQTFQQMIRAVESSQWTEAKHWSHYLQGGGARILDPTLQRGLEQLEKMCDSQFPQVSKSDLAALQDQFDLACRTARIWLHERSRYATA